MPSPQSQRYQCCKHRYRQPKRRTIQEESRGKPNYQRIIVNKDPQHSISRVEKCNPHNVLAIRSNAATAVLEDAFVNPALSSISERVVPHKSDSSVFSTKVVVILEVLGDVGGRSAGSNWGSEAGTLSERRGGDRDGEEGDGRDDGSGELHEGRVQGGFERNLVQVYRTVVSRVILLEVLGSLFIYH